MKMTNKYQLEVILKGFLSETLNERYSHPIMDGREEEVKEELEDGLAFISILLMGSPSSFELRREIRRYTKRRDLYSFYEKVDLHFSYIRELLGEEGGGELEGFHEGLQRLLKD